MQVDTDAVRAFGLTHAAAGGDVGAVAAAMASFPVEAAAVALGPVGARFVAALSEVTSTLAADVSVVAEAMAHFDSGARAAAVGFAEMDDDAGVRLGRIGV